MNPNRKPLLTLIKRGVVLGGIYGAATFVLLHFFRDNIVLGGVLVGIVLFLMYLVLGNIRTWAAVLVPRRRIRFKELTKRGAVFGGMCGIVTFVLFHFFSDNMPFGGAVIGSVVILLYLASGDFQ